VKEFSEMLDNMLLEESLRGDGEGGDTRVLVRDKGTHLHVRDNSRLGEIRGYKG